MSSISKLLPSPILRLGWELRHRVALFPKTGERRILVVQLAGLGNSILTTPLISALASLSPRPFIDILIDRKRGSGIAFDDWDLVHRLWDIREMDATSQKLYYDIVIDAHPNSYLPKRIRYKERKYFPLKAEGFPEYHWRFERHEAEYLIDHARSLGYKGEVPPLRIQKSFLISQVVGAKNSVALGIGYYKGPLPGGGDSRDRHWGNENFLMLGNLLKSAGYAPVMVGDKQDQAAEGRELEAAGIESVCGKLTLEQMVAFIGGCCAFIGNDTGLMHVAAALDIPTVGIFTNTNSVKSYPLGRRCLALGGDRGRREYAIPPSDVWDAFVRLTADTSVPKVVDSLQ